MYYVKLNRNLRVMKVLDRTKVTINPNTHHPKFFFICQERSWTLGENDYDT